MRDASSARHLFFGLAIGLLLTLIVQLPRLLDPYAIEDDFRNLHWLHRYDDAVEYAGRPLDPELRRVPCYRSYFLLDGDVFLKTSPFYPLAVSFFYSLLGEGG